MKPAPSRTTNRLHFDDLEPSRFEDLCLALVYPLHPWTDLRHYGRSGSDAGVDIFAREQAEDGVERLWLIQCRRYSRATKATLTKAVDDALAGDKSIPDVLLVVVGCNVSRSAHEGFVSYASAKGIRTPLLWAASVLEASLHSERRDLLFSYFGIPEVNKDRARDAGISRNIGLKKRLLKDLLAEPKSVNWEKARKSPPDKFVHSEAIVHSVDDNSYPAVDEDSLGIRGWFKLEVWDFYYNGLGFILGVERGVVDAEGYWAIVGSDQPFDTTRFREIKMFRIGFIPYRNIVDCDVLGDEIYSCPHLYCRFANGGQPYDGFGYVLISDDYPWAMQAHLQLDPGSVSGGARPNTELQQANHSQRKGKSRKSSAAPRA